MNDSYKQYYYVVSILVMIVSCGLFKTTCRPDRIKYQIDARIRVFAISHLGDSFR